MKLIAAFRNAFKLAAYDLGRVDGASAPAVVLIDPVTGNAVAGSKDTSQYLSVNTTQVLTTSAISAQSAAVGASTNRVVIGVTKDTWIALGSNPTATKTAGSFFLSGGSQSYPIAVTAGVTKIAALQDSAAGSVSIIESA